MTAVSEEGREIEFTERYASGRYLDDAPEWHAEDSEWKAGKIHRILTANSVSPTSVVDVGCGAGGVLARLQELLPQDVRLDGYDIAAAAVELARPHANEHLAFHNADFLETDDRYDVVMALDVFEHVPDYLGFLSALKDRGSFFVFHIPLDANATSVLKGSDYMLHMRSTFGHLHYFTAETAVATLRDTGYEVVDSMYTWDFEQMPEATPTSNPARKAVRAVKQVGRAARLGLNRRRPSLAARIFSNYSLLVLARVTGSSDRSGG